MPYRINLIVFILIIICNHPRIYAQEKIQFTQNLDSLIQQYLIEKDIPSASVGIVSGQESIFAKRFIKDKNQLDQKPTFNSVYNIASVAKSFVATAILLLEQEGKLKLDHQVIQYLPYFKTKSKYSEEITIRQLLTHTSGLPSVISPDAYEYKNPSFGEDALEKHIKKLNTVSLKFKPGKKFGYSNVAYEVLGDLIAKLSRMTFEKYMEEHLFKPLEMTQTSYFPKQFAQEVIAPPSIEHPYQVSETFPYDRAFSPSGNLLTTAEDMNKWMIFNLNQGKYKDFSPLQSKSFDQLHTGKVDTKEDGFYGLGWYTKSIKMGKIIFHDGLDLGYSSLLVLFENQKIGIIVMTNHQDTDCNELLNIVVKSIQF